MSKGKSNAKRLSCPSCNAVISFRAEKDNLGVCPHCGEWLMAHGHWNRHLERLDSGTGKDFDESSDWETHLTERLDVRAVSSCPSRGRRWLT